MQENNRIIYVKPNSIMQCNAKISTRQCAMKNKFQASATQKPVRKKFRKSITDITYLQYLTIIFRVCLDTPQFLNKIHLLTSFYLLVNTWLFKLKVD